MVTQLYESLPALTSKYLVVSHLSLISRAFQDKEEPIKSFYDELCSISVRRSRGFLRIGPTASSKLLHFMFPNLYVIWDRRWVRDPQHYGETSDEYYRYLTNKRELLASVICESGRMTKDIVEWLVLQHSMDLEWIGLPHTLEPITKLLDEINFGNKHQSSRLGVKSVHTLSE
jgi:hypothetical protein